jgi:ribosomal-protein-alanine N-acetyltransferase
MSLIETERLSLRQFVPEDAPFILELLNEPSFIQNIADRGVRTLADARRYIEDGPIASYAKHGFGLYLVTLRESGVPIGMCGILKRAGLADADIGYALLPRFWSQGYAAEAAAAVLAYGRTVLGLARIVAITAPDNDSSIRLLEKLGYRFEQMVRLPNIEGESRLFLPAASP